MYLFLAKNSVPCSLSLSLHSTWSRFNFGSIGRHRNTELSIHMGHPSPVLFIPYWSDTIRHMTHPSEPTISQLQASYVRSLQKILPPPKGMPLSLFPAKIQALKSITNWVKHLSQVLFNSQSPPHFKVQTPPNIS